MEIIALVGLVFAMPLANHGRAEIGELRHAPLHLAVGNDACFALFERRLLRPSARAFDDLQFIGYEANASALQNLANSQKLGI